jgi:hypothetical protein
MDGKAAKRQRVTRKALRVVVFIIVASNWEFKKYFSLWHKEFALYTQKILLFFYPFMSGYQKQWIG